MPDTVDSTVESRRSVMMAWEREDWVFIRVELVARAARPCRSSARKCALSCTTESKPAEPVRKVTGGAHGLPALASRSWMVPCLRLNSSISHGVAPFGGAGASRSRNESL